MDRVPRRIQVPGHLALNVPDLPRAVDFYTRIIRMHKVEETENAVYLRSRYEHHCLELHLADEAGVRHIGWETGDDEATEALRELLVSKGVTVRDAPEEPARLGVAFQFLDPMGMWHEVYRAMGREAVTVSDATFPIFRPGHYTFITIDPEGVMEFFRGVGFRVSDVSPGKYAFVRCNPEHHNIGLLKYSRTQLHHHAYHLKSWNEIKRVLDHCWQERHPVSAGPLRHGPANNITVYIRDPNGIRVEFYCEMELIEDDEDHLTRRHEPFFFDLWHQTAPPEGFRD